MKYLSILLFLLVSAPAAGSDGRAEKLFDAANTAYVNNDFLTATEYYDSIAAMGLQSAGLYYNMGNAYFKSGKIGAAILYYNKAQRLAPLNSDIDYNLTVANTYTRDNIGSVPQFFARRWIVGFRSLLSSNAWAWLSVLFFGLLMVGALLYLLPLSLGARKTGLGLGIASAAIFALSVTFASVQRRESLHPREGVVMMTALPVKSSPDASSKDLFVLHEGTKVEITDALNDWREITLSDGHSGWIMESSIALID